MANGPVLQASCPKADHHQCAPSICDAWLCVSSSRTASQKRLYSFFQLPLIPEALLRARRFQVLKNALRASSRPGTFVCETIALYEQAWAQPGALTAMLNWYRAAGRSRPKKPLGQIRAPVLLIWGKQDGFLQAGLAKASLEWCSNGHTLLFEDEGHWVQHERAGELNAVIVQFLTWT